MPNKPANSIIARAKVDNSWQQQLSYGFTGSDQLLKYLGLNTQDLPYAIASDSKFGTVTTKFYADLIEKNNGDDPLLLQVLPQAIENDKVANFSLDPLAESAKANGAIKKYNGRVLLITTGKCAINCRYCFRRHFDYGQHIFSRSNWQKIIANNLKDKTVNEVILSGGDPLTLNDKQLQFFIDEISKYPRINKLRIHTRLPIVLPARIDDDFIKTILSWQKTITVVLHINHPNEISPELIAVCKKLHSLGVILLNQSVLLKMSIIALKL